MRKILLFAFIISASYFFTSCSGKETAQSVAEKWCKLNAKFYQAADEETREAARKAREAYEETIENKYKGNDAFMEEVKTEVEKCEEASEGRE